ncbi:MAG: hydantoinase/oxoprolinase family protein, partial [Acidimicrobiales bacterium]
MSVRIGIDTGGTFTDVVAFDETTGALHATKTPSVPADPSLAFADGLRLILDQAGRDAVEVTTVSHGTTVATNALLEDDTGGLGLLTTHGFRHVLEIARQSVPDGYGNSYFWVKPDRIVPLHLVREVPERLDAEGQVVRELDEDAVVEQVQLLRDEGVHSIGVCLLHSYLNPAHEERVAEIIAEVYPEASVSISSQVLREYREYERSVTTLVDAFVKNKVVHYIDSIQAQLDQLRDGEPPAFYIMKSNGGVISAGAVGTQPITTVLSGPAAGALGAAELTGRAGFDQVLALDGGGTSTDVTVVQGAVPALTTEGSVGRHPTKVPMIDIVTVGTGGGSIAWVSPEGGLKVGPRSAGADPGPLCYGKGGTEATVTDAHLVLGRIPPGLIGGRVPLHVDAARAGIEELAGDLGLGTEECAAGVLEIAAWNQANAIRQVTVRRGLDVRDFALCGFGGSGP